MSTILPAPAPAESGLSLAPLMLETFVATLAMMSFVALIGRSR